MTLVKEIELNATQAQVWNAVATAPGLETWYAPSELDPQIGGIARSDFGNNTVAEGVILVYEPGERIVFGSERIVQERGGKPEPYTDARLEFRIKKAHNGTASRGGDFVELAGRVADALGLARSGGPRTVLQVRQDGFPDEGQETYEEGWDVYFHTLSQYFIYFAGLPARATASLVIPPLEREVKFERITRALLGISPADYHVGSRVSVKPQGRDEVINGVIDLCSTGGSCNVVGVRTDTALIKAAAGGDTCGVQLNVFEYVSNPAPLFDSRKREEQALLLRRDAEDWQSWLEQQFPE
jgi:uncharacterized protein YndB with AHSA1/START domain